MALIRKNTGTSVMLRVYGLFIFLICFYSLNANGNEEQSCNKKFTENLNHVISLLPEGGTPEYGIETTKLEVLGRITQCVELKKCPLSDQLMIFSEILVDDEMVDLQKKKILTLKKYYQDIEGNDNSCAFIKTTPLLIKNLNRINKLQLKRMKKLANELIPS